MYSGLEQLKREITSTVNDIFGTLNGDVENRRLWGSLYGTLFRMHLYPHVRQQTPGEVRAGILWEREMRMLPYQQNL